VSDLILRPSDAETEAHHLRVRILQLEDQLRAANERCRIAEARLAEAQSAVGRLRQNLRPFYEAMRQLFGEMDKVSGGEGPSVPGRAAVIWESWKDKLGQTSTCARIIDALLQHEEMSVAQLRVACKAGQQTIYDATSKMARLGLLDRHAGRYRLKKI
jgi:hypothetical protein